eukprot:2050687-Prymnesium_polylepis.1
MRHKVVSVHESGTRGSGRVKLRVLTNVLAVVGVREVEGPANTVHGNVERCASILQGGHLG